jgi:hypothetical protein
VGVEITRREWMIGTGFYFTPLGQFTFIPSGDKKKRLCMICFMSEEREEERSLR